MLACLLCYDLGGRALWTDEGFSLAAARPFHEAVFSDASHPPGYQLLLHFWLRSAPAEPRGRDTHPSASDGWLRAFSVPWTLLTGWLGWLIAARLGLKREGLLAAWLLALSPLALTYFRLGRYYSMAAALTMLCLLSLVWLWERPGWARALVAGVAVALIGYTDYTGLVLVLTVLALAGLFALVKRRWALLGMSALAGLSGLLLLLPLIIMTAERAATVAAIAADPLAHSKWGVLIKLGLPVFSLATGECVDPWRWLITLPALTVTVVLLLAGLWALTHAKGPGRLMALVWPLNIIVATAMLSTVAANVPPNRVTSFAVFTLPLAYLLLAAGALRLPRRWLSVLLLLPLAVAYAYGISNYFRGQQLLNQGFAPPWRQVAETIEREEQAEDLILSAEDVFGRYYNGRAEIGTEPQLREMINGGLPPGRRLWLIVRDRGSQPLLLLGLKLRGVAHSQGYTERVFDIVPRTPEEQRMLSLVLRREAADAYVKLYLLEKPESAPDQGRPVGP